MDGEFWKLSNNNTDIDYFWVLAYINSHGWVQQWGVSADALFAGEGAELTDLSVTVPMPPIHTATHTF